MSSTNGCPNKVTTGTLGNLLRALIKSNVKAWDLLLLNAEFAYKNAPTKMIGMSPFKVVYGLNSISLLDLMPRVTDEKHSVEASKRIEEI